MDTIQINDSEITDLLKSLKDEIISGKNNSEYASDKQKIISYWNIGYHINTYLKTHQGYMNYGQYLFKTLSDKLKFNLRSLYLSVQFNNIFPKKSMIYYEIPWSHYKTLVTISSQRLRDRYISILLKNKLSYRDFYTLIKKDQDFDGITNIDKLTFIKGVPYTYNMKTVNSKNFIDLGFKMYSGSYCDIIDRFDPSTVIRSVKTEGTFEFNSIKQDTKTLYTYKAYITKVVDGDTIVADIDLGFDQFTTQRLRLRGIDAPELNSDDGLKARDFILSSFKDIEFVVVKTYHPDKYSRYLADVFYESGKDLTSVIKEKNFLNKQLLDNKLVFKYFS